MFGLLRHRQPKGTETIGLIYGQEMPDLYSIQIPPTQPLFMGQQAVAYAIACFVINNSAKGFLPDVRVCLLIQRCVSLPEDIYGTCSMAKRMNLARF